MNDDVYLALVAYGLRLLGQATKNQEEAKELMGNLLDLVAWEAYEKLLGPKRPPEEALSSIFSCVALPDQEGEPTLPQTAYYVARPLALERETLFPLHVNGEGEAKRLATLEEALARLDLPRLWAGFAAEYQTLWERFRPEREVLFEAFYHLM